MANLLDNRFSLFGVRFGAAAVFDLIPEFGDMINMFLSFYLVWIGIQMGIPAVKLIEMIVNILINFIIALIPVIGDATYIFRRANMKNLQILQNYNSSHRVIEGIIV